MARNLFLDMPDGVGYPLQDKLKQLRFLLNYFVKGTLKSATTKVDSMKDETGLKLIQIHLMMVKNQLPSDETLKKLLREVEDWEDLNA